MPTPIDILIVEDDPTTYQALPALLSKYGFNCIVVNNVKDALEILKLEPKFVLVDLVLPGMDNGFDILKMLKESNLKTKCAVTTGYMKKDIDVYGYPTFVKPIDLDQLLNFLNKK